MPRFKGTPVGTRPVDGDTILTQRLLRRLELNTAPRSSFFFVVSILTLAIGVSAPAAAQVCGNGIIESGEECDDGADFRLDGCSAECTYEHVQRMIQIELVDGMSPATCTPNTNAFGRAFTPTGLAAINSLVSAGIADGSIDSLLQVLSLDDPAAVTDPALDVGVLSAQPDLRGGGATLDSWHVASPEALDADDLPVIQLPGSVASRSLTAGPTRIEIDFFGGTLTVRDSWITAIVDPQVSLPAPPPDQLAAGFQSFEALTADDGQHGLCGNTTVGTLALLPIPEELGAGGMGECSSSCPDSGSYVWCGEGNPVGPDCNSLLDVLVSGCAVSPPLCIGLADPTQPDVGTGGQAPELLVADPTTFKVTVVEPEDAYSMWVEFASQRVHMTNNIGAIFADGFESSDTGAWSSTLP
jgi:cysteine-rich repeat protein